MISPFNYVLSRFGYALFSLDKVLWFHLIFLFGHFLERHSFVIVSCEPPETMRKLYLSVKFPHQGIRWSYKIFQSIWFGYKLFKFSHALSLFDYKLSPCSLFVHSLYELFTFIYLFSILFTIEQACSKSYLHITI